MRAEGKMASPRRFERPTLRLGGECSIQLSYGDMLCILTVKNFIAIFVVA